MKLLNPFSFEYYAKSHLVEQAMVFGRSARNPLRFRKHLENSSVNRIKSIINKFSGI